MENELDGDDDSGGWSKGSLTKLSIHLGHIGWKMLEQALRRYA